MTTIKIEVDGKKYVGIPEDDYAKLTHEGLLPLPQQDGQGRYPVSVLDINLANQTTLWRRAAGLTQRELADAAGVTHETISRFERGKIPKLSTTKKIAAVLEARLPWEEFLKRS